MAGVRRGRMDRPLTHGLAALFAVCEGTALKRIYVGNLSFNTTKEGLEAAFSEFGQVTNVAIITDRDTGRSRGFAFVEMSDDKAAGDAISALNGKEVDGRTLTVNEARPREDRPGGGEGYRGGRR